MPVLFGLFLVLAVYIGTLPGASEGYKYILTLNPAGLAKLDLWVFAFGQAFFSLSVAGNGSVIYGSYLSKARCPSSATLQYLIPWQLCWQPVVIIPATQLFWAKASRRKEVARPDVLYLVNVFNAMPAVSSARSSTSAYCSQAYPPIVNLYEAPIAFLRSTFKFKYSSRLASSV